LKKLFYILIVLFILTQSGCGWVRIAMRSVGRSITDSPEIAWNKIQNPVKDSVRLSALWGGQSTVLVQMYDKVILFDPLFNDYILGVLPRLRETALEYDSIKKLDLIAVSHAHMDHLSFSSLDKLSKMHPQTALIFPEGAEEFLPDFNLDMIRADTIGAFSGHYTAKPVYINGLKVIPVFALHDGGRYGFDTYLWNVQGYCGYIVQYKDLTVYFAGDTGYDDKAFKEIGKQFKIDLALIPIGPCRNCEGKGMWFHTSSYEAVKLFLDIKAKYMIPIHYGTLQYFGSPDIPAEALKNIISNPENYFSDNNSAGLKDYLINGVKILNYGGQIIFDSVENNSINELQF